MYASIRATVLSGDFINRLFTKIAPALVSKSAGVESTVMKESELVSSFRRKLNEGSSSFDMSSNNLSPLSEKSSCANNTNFILPISKMILVSLFSFGSAAIISATLGLTTAEAGKLAYAFPFRIEICFSSRVVSDSPDCEKTVWKEISILNAKKAAFTMELMIFF